MHYSIKLMKQVSIVLFKIKSVYKKWLKRIFQGILSYLFLWKRNYMLSNISKDYALQLFIYIPCYHYFFIMHLKIFKSKILKYISRKKFPLDLKDLFNCTSLLNNQAFMCFGCKIFCYIDCSIIYSHHVYIKRTANLS